MKVKSKQPMLSDDLGFLVRLFQYVEINQNFYTMVENFEFLLSLNNITVRTIYGDAVV